MAVDNIDSIMQNAGINMAGKTEKPAETKQETVTETNIETSVQANDGKKEETKQTTESVNWMESFNKAIGREFKDEEEVKNLLKTSDEYSTVKAKVEEYEKMIAEKDKALQDYYNPMTYFANEQQYTINQILKKNPELNYNVVNRIVTTNLSDMADKDVLILNEVLTAKGAFDESVVDRIVTKKYGLNVNKDELDEEGLRDYKAQEWIMKKDADKARSELTKLLEVDKPKAIDPVLAKKEQVEKDNQLFGENKAKWDMFTNEFVKKFENLKVEYALDDKQKDTFTFGVDEKFKAVLKEKLPLIAAMNKKDVNNPNDVKALIEMVEKDFLWLNKEAMFKTLREDIVSKITEEEFKKYHNPKKPTGGDQAPIRTSEEERLNQATADKLLSDFGLKRKK